MTRKLLVILIILVGAGCAAIYFATGRRPRGIVLTGIVSTNEVYISSQTGGLIERLDVKEGDRVTKGELIAVIDPRQYQADHSYYTESQESYSAQVLESEAALRYQELQTRDQIRQAEASLAAAKAQLAQATANRLNASQNFERTHKLFDQGVMSAQANDQAETTLAANQGAWDASQKQVAAAEAALALAESSGQQIAVRRAQLEANRRQWAAAGAQAQKAQVLLSETQIYAPVSGTVDVRAALGGEVVNAGQTIVSLIDPDALWVSVNIPETYIDRIRLGEKLGVRFPSGMEKEGTVFFRGVDSGFATERDVSRTKRDIKTFEFRLRVDNSDRRIWPGLTAYVALPQAVRQ
ncbi:MAG: HlyD family secretion protein [Acidobacteriota bacterium]|nr:HlyD family secretion protein [Acidobacteriota bacterium]